MPSEPEGVPNAEPEGVPTPPHRLPALYVVLAGAWLSGTALLLLWLTACQWHLARLRRGAMPITAGPAAEALARLTASLRVRPPLLLASPRVRSPFLAGMIRPAILLPATWEADYDPPTLQAILAHELAHLSRRDCAWTLLLRLTCAALWPQPLLWLLARQLEQATEEACDLMVLAQDCLPRQYADCLLALAERVLPSPAERMLGAGVVPVRSSLGRRIQNILDRRNLAMPAIPLHTRAVITLGTAAVVTGVLCLVATSLPAQTHPPFTVADRGAVSPADALSQAQFLAGLTPVQGPGIIVTLRESRKPVPHGWPNGAAPPNLVHDTDINAVDNGLKAAGAEAIAINGQRLIATSPIRSAGPTIFVNNVALTPPYVIRAIGDTAAMQIALNQPGGVIAQFRTFDPAMIQVQEAGQITLPAYRGDVRSRYARPVLSAPGRNGQVPTTAGKPRRFSILWSAPRTGTHHLRVFVRDASGQRLVLDRDCQPRQMVRVNVSATGQHIGFLLYDNGRLVANKQAPEFRSLFLSQSSMAQPTQADRKRLATWEWLSKAARRQITRDVYIGDLAALERSRDEVQIQLQVAQKSAETYSRLAASREPSVVIAMSPRNRPEAQRLQSQIVNAKEELQELSVHFTPRHPARRRAQAWLKALQEEYNALLNEPHTVSRPNPEYTALLAQADVEKAEAARAQATIASLDTLIWRVKQEQKHTQR
ncbi:MAG: DUF881 domain-containing protein [Armatimonadetes bacterium]|nr:DUF881 domain-containing protein [Armatimonadota bacterium]